MSRKDWNEVVEDYKASGLSQAEYGKRHGLLPSRLSYWLCKEKREKNFVRVEARGEKEIIELEFLNGVKARIPVGTAGEYIRTLMGALS